MRCDQPISAGIYWHGWVLEFFMGNLVIAWLTCVMTDVKTYFNCCQRELFGWTKNIGKNYKLNGEKNQWYMQEEGPKFGPNHWL